MTLFKNYYQKYQSIPLAARAALWFMASMILQKSIAFITIPIFTRIMPATEYGIYSTYLSWLGILSIFCTMNMETCIYVNLYTQADTKSQKDDAAVSLISLTGIITFTFFIFYLIFHRYLSDVIQMPFGLVCLLFAQIIFRTPMNFWSMQQRFEFKYVALVIRTLLMVVLNAFLGVIFVILSERNQALARVLSVVIVQAIFGIWFYIYFLKDAKKIFLFKGWKHALEVQLPLLPHGLSITVLNSSDRILINNLVGSAEAGIYSVAYSAGYLVEAFKSSIIDAYRPWMYQKIKEKNYDSIKAMSNSLLVFVMIISILFSAFGPEIIKIMAPVQYQEAIYVIPPVAASTFFTFLYNVFSVVGMYHEKTKLIMAASVFGAIINIILNLVFIPIFGYLVAAYTTLICYILFAFAHYLIMTSINRSILGNVKMFDMRFISLMSVVILISIVFFELTYSNIFIRYGIIFVVVVSIYIKRDFFVRTVNVLNTKRSDGQ